MFPWMREVWYNRKSSSRTAEPSSSKADTAMLMPGTEPSENFSISVVSLEGNVANITVKSDFTIERIKTIVMKHFYGNDSTKIPSQYRLIHSFKFKQLGDNSNVNDEEIKEHDELILIQIRSPPAKEDLSQDVLKGPSKEAILQATRDLPVHNLTQPIPPLKCFDDFQNELQKILITLVKASARILTYSPEAQKYYDILQEKLKARCKPNIDSNVVKTLMEMGYSHKKAVKALRLRKSNITEALEWLIENQDNPDDYDEDDDLDLLISSESNNNKDVAGPSSSVNAKKKSLKEACIELFKGENQSPKKTGNLITIVDFLVESFQRYQKMDFKPNSKAVQSLLEMGFEEKSIIGALKITGNNHVNACEWLLGERRPSLQNLGQGLDSDGPIYKGIMNNPHIQLSLTNPKMLLVYLSMLETPSSTNVWLNDPEVQPVLSEIIKTYRVEKHAIHFNRYAAKSY
ncbi:kip1 ubiquitination-promoting complex subunit 2 [Calliopsis andreniformis]|uniref:kip1 ubiquitination-promoting complex subunit 2 n=1 Tax=Calliopsis andreniformis TaxID=337506 RepID=UPI003FCD1FC7